MLFLLTIDVHCREGMDNAEIHGGRGGPEAGRLFNAASRRLAG